MADKLLNTQQVQALEDIHKHGVKPDWLKGRPYNWVISRGLVEKVEETDGEAPTRAHRVTPHGYVKLYEYWRDRYNRLEKQLFDK